MMKKSKYKIIGYVFLFHCGLALLAIAGQMLANGGLYTLCDDFNDQQIPFAMLINEAVKNGAMGWNWSIDLGSDMLASMSYYSLGSPFLWITLLFPKSVIPYLTGWILILKYGIAGVTSFLYFKRFVKEEKYALLASMLYTFSGFQCTNLVFYSFHDVVAFFPLLLIGLEKLTEENKKGWLAFAVALNTLVNYYFFTQEVIFLVLYFVCKNGIIGAKRWKQIMQCFLEGIMGVLMAAVLLLPTFMQVMTNSRVGKLIPKEAWIDTSRRYLLQLIRVFMFPGETMGRQSSIQENIWSSWSAYLPMVGIGLVVCYFLKRKWDWLARTTMICMLFAVIPVLNSAFGLFAESNYYRWYFMLILVMSLASAKVLEDSDSYPVKRITAVVALFMILVTAVFPWWDQHKFQLIFDQQVFTVLSVTGILGVILLLFLFLLVKNKNYRYRYLLVGIATFSVFTTAYTSLLYQNCFNETPSGYYNRITAYQQFTMPEDGYRLASPENTVIIPAALRGTGSFHSTVSGSIFEFYESIGESRAVFSPETTEETNRLFSGKYEITEEVREEVREGQEPIQTARSKDKTYYMYEKDNIMPIGFVYYTYLLRSEFDLLDNEEKPPTMLKTLVIPDEAEKMVSKQLTHYIDLDSVEKQNLESGVKEGSSAFKITKAGFEASIQSERGGYAFFSVPFEKGWKATVNSSPTEIVKINGLMAVALFEGSNEVVFTYSNKMVSVGLLVSIVALIATIIYTKCCNLREKGNAI